MMDGVSLYIMCVMDADCGMLHVIGAIAPLLATATASLSTISPSTPPFALFPLELRYTIYWKNIIRFDFDTVNHNVF